MTKREVESIIGVPSGGDPCFCTGNGGCTRTNNYYSGNCTEWFYGTVKIKFEAGIVSYKKGCK